MYNPYESIKKHIKQLDQFDYLMNAVVDTCNNFGSFALYKDGVKLFSWKVENKDGQLIVVGFEESALTPSPEKEPKLYASPKVPAFPAEEDFSWSSSNPLSGWNFEDVGSD